MDCIKDRNTFYKLCQRVVDRLRRFHPNFTLRSRRKQYYIRCQEIIDDLHQKVANKDFIDIPECKKQYGNADFNALLQELQMINAHVDLKEMTPSMEWLYYSRYFTFKANEERAERWQRLAVWVAAIAAIASAICAYKSASKESPPIYINYIPAAEYRDSV